MATRDVLGSGWKFPIRINARGGFSWSTDEQLVQESVWIILGTALNERRMLPNFGCGIHQYLFAANNANNRGLIANQVRKSLVQWEPRIDVLDVRVESPEPHQLLIRVDYRIRATNTIEN